MPAKLVAMLVGLYFAKMGWVTFHYPPHTITAPIVTGYLLTLGGVAIIGRAQFSPLTGNRQRWRMFDTAIITLIVFTCLVRAWSIWSVYDWTIAIDALGLIVPLRDAEDGNHVAFYNGGVLWVAHALGGWLMLPQMFARLDHPEIQL